MKPRTIKPGEANATPVTPLDAEHAGQPSNGGAGREEVKKAEEIARLEDSILPNSAVSAPSNIEATLEGILDDQSFTDEDVSYDVGQLVMGRPSKVMPFRIHPELFRDVTLYVKPGVQREYYVVARNMERLIDGAGRYTVFFGVHRDGNRFLWPISATSQDNYSKSARQIAVKGMDEWTRLVADRAKGSYTGRFFGGKLAKVAPEWGQPTTFTKLLAEAVGSEGIIMSKDHPVYRELWPEE
jgi:hypothetical protein